MPHISVVTTFYNSETTIAETMRSIQMQDYTDYEHILIDDGSEDGSIEIVDKIKDERVRIYKPGRVGRAEALNIGLHHAKGKYVAILDADDIALPSRLSKQKNILDGDSQLSLVFQMLNCMIIIMFI